MTEHKLLTAEDAARIKSKRRYWEEVCGREYGGGEILRQEMREEAQALGLTKLLWIVSRYAKIEEGEADA